MKNYYEKCVNRINEASEVKQECFRKHVFGFVCGGLSLMRGHAPTGYAYEVRYDEVKVPLSGEEAERLHNLAEEKFNASREALREKREKEALERL